MRPSRMKRVVVTGTSGRIGGAVRLCLAERYDVMGLDRVPSPLTDVVADVTDADALRAIFEGATAIVHSAGLHAPHVGELPDSEFEHVNVRGTEAVVRAAKAAGIRRLVLTSTTALYGRANGELDPSGAAWIDETTNPLPRTIYHRTKLAAEAVVRDAASSDMIMRVLRMSRCFPEPADVMAAYRLHRGVDARDVAEAHRLAIEHQGDPFELFVVSAPTPFEPSDAQALRSDAESIIRTRAPDVAALFDRRGWSLPRTIDRVYDPAVAMRALGWRPRYGPTEVAAQLDAGDVATVLPIEDRG